VSNAPSKPVSFSRPKVGYFSNRPRILLSMIFIVRLTQQYDVRLSYVQLIELHVSTLWDHLQAYKI